MNKVALAVILANSNNEVLMFRRDNDPKIKSPNKWCVFTGRMEERDIEPGEEFSVSAERGARRELGEELSILDNNTSKPFVSGGLNFFWYDKTIFFDGTPQQRYVFTGRIYVPLERLRLEEGQGETLSFLNREQITRKDIAANYRRILRNYFLTRA